MRGASEVELDSRVATDVLGNPARALQRLAKRKETLLDIQKDHFLVMANGPDRVGIVRDMASAIGEFGGSIATSKMMRLAGNFSVMMLVSVNKGDSSNRLLERIANLEGLQVITKTARHHSEPDTDLAFRARVQVLGKEETPGMVLGLTDFLAARDINIEELTSESSLTDAADVQHKPDSPVLLEAGLASVRAVDLDELQLGLKGLATKLGVQVEVSDVHVFAHATKRTPVLPEVQMLSSTTSSTSLVTPRPQLLPSSRPPAN